MQIADGKYDKAVRTLQTGYAFARHVAQGPVLVQGLVGDSIARMMSKQVETLIQQPGAPNLYWALALLPRPMIDLRLALEAEMETVYFSYPELRDLGTKNYPPEYWRQLWDGTVEKVWRMRHFNDRGNVKQDSPTDKEQFDMLATAVESYPRAKRSLVAEGHSAAEVEAMPVHQFFSCTPCGRSRNSATTISSGRGYRTQTSASVWSKPSASFRLVFAPLVRSYLSPVRFCRQS